MTDALDNCYLILVGGAKNLPSPGNLACTAEVFHSCHIHFR